MSKREPPQPNTQTSRRPSLIHENVPQEAPTHEQIARRAYELYLARGGTHGSEQADWFQAERELRQFTAPQQDTTAADVKGVGHEHAES